MRRLRRHILAVKKGYKMKAVITVIGKDNVGIISAISAECAKFNVNIVDITQSVLQENSTFSNPKLGQ